MNVITKSEIKDKLLTHCRGNDRKLMTFYHTDSYENVGTVFFSLNGSPPKGYAVYIKDACIVSFYDKKGRRFRKLTNTDVELEKNKKGG